MFLKQPTPSSDAPVNLLALDNQLCFALYAASRVMTRSYREQLEPLGLTYPQYLVLLVLWETDGLTVSGLGQRLRLDSGTLTPLIKRLETAGFVVKQRRTSDEREVEVRLSAKGRDMQQAAHHVREKVVCDLQMTEAEIGALRTDLIAMVNRLGGECGLAPSLE
jgi:MarR family transcriptional regulator, organic hydroperoxide resistance regulator